MVTMPRASLGSDGGRVRFCVRKTSMPSSSAVPTLMSARSTDAYESNSALIWPSSSPWSTGPWAFASASSASLSANGSFLATAANSRPTMARSEAESVPVMPRSIHTMSSPRTRMLPGCGSAWKKPLSMTCVT